MQDVFRKSLKTLALIIYVFLFLAIKKRNKKTLDWRPRPLLSPKEKGDKFCSQKFILFTTILIVPLPRRGISG
jgi:hypothetical protein